jgi:hypothetical protein
MILSQITAKILVDYLRYTPSWGLTFPHDPGMICASCSVALTVPLRLPECVLPPSELTLTLDKNLSLK